MPHLRCHSLVYIIIFISAVLIPVKGHTQPTASLKNFKHSQNISPILGVLSADRYPPDSDDTISQATRLFSLTDSEFRYLRQNRLLLEGSQSGYWIRGKILNSTEAIQELVLNLSSSHLGDGRLLIRHASEAIQQKIFLRNRNSKNQYLSADMAFRLTLKTGVTEFLIYLNPLNSHSEAYHIPVDLMTPELYDQQKISALLFYAIFFGFIFAMLIYNLILYLRVSYKGYIYYCLYLTAFICGALPGTGMIYLLPFSVPDWFIRPLFTLTPLLVAICLVQFARIILNLKKTFPQVDRRYGYALWFLSIALPLSQIESGSLSVPLHVIATLIALSMGIVAFVAHRRFKIAGAWVLTLSFGSICIGFLLYSALRLWPFHEQLQSATLIAFLEWMENYVFLVSTLVEMSLMSLALATFIRRAEEDKIAAQQDKLETVLEMGRLKDEYSQQLEKDVTQRTQEISAQKQQLEMHSEFRNRFFNYISHEFRTPLTLSLGPLHDLENNRYGPIKESLLTPLHLIKHNNERLLKLTDRILELTQSEHGKIQLQIEQFSLTEAITSLLVMFDDTLKGKGMNLTHNLDQNEFQSLNIYYDRLHFDCIITNLLANAINYSVDNTELNLHIEQDDRGISVALSNTSTRIPPDQLPRMFEHNFRLESNRTSTHGYGIGLSLVREFVQEHGGSVFASNDDDGMTCISFTIHKGCSHLPRTLVQQQDLVQLRPLTAIAQPASEQTPPNDSHTKILIVDDHQEMRQYLKQLLLRQKFQVITAIDGNDGLQQCQNSMPDLVIADVIMPNMGGLEMVANIRADDQTRCLPVILLSSNAHKRHQIDGIEGGADDYLCKPFVPDELLARVNRILKQRQLLRERFQQELARIQSPTPPKGFAEQVKYHIYQHLSDPDFNLERLAQLMAMDRSTLYRHGKQHLDTPLKTLILNTRLSLAAEQLKQKPRISDVAYSVGFNSMSYFSKKFNEKYQMTPSVWQQLHQSECMNNLS